MPETPSTMLDLGTALPSFTLPDFNGRTVSDADFTGAQGLLVAFICKHCPFVKHIRQEFVRFANEYAAKGLEVVAIASNDVRRPSTSKSPRVRRPSPRPMGCIPS